MSMLIMMLGMLVVMMVVVMQVLALLAFVPLRGFPSVRVPSFPGLSLFHPSSFTCLSLTLPLRFSLTSPSQESSP